MPIPPQYSTFGQWYSAVANILNRKQMDFSVFERYWAQFDATQRTMIKNDVIATNNAQIAELQAINTYVGTLS